MNVLALDTATADLVVGLVHVDADSTISIRAEENLTDSRAHNEMLVPTVQKILAESSLEFSALDAIVVGIGPGPFTGLRVGMATAAAFGDALAIPVHGVCTHDAIAHLISNDEQLKLEEFVVATDARRKEIYWSSYRNNTRIAGPEVCKPALLGQPAAESDHKLGHLPAISIPERLQDTLSTQPDTVLHYAPTAASLVGALLDTGCDIQISPRPLEPLYLRRPDVKEPTAKPKSQAIPDYTPPTQGQSC